MSNIDSDRFDYRLSIDVICLISYVFKSSLIYQLPLYTMISS